MAEEADTSKEADKEAEGGGRVAPIEKEDVHEKEATPKPTKFDPRFYVDQTLDEKNVVTSTKILSMKGLEWSGNMVTSITGPTRHTNNATLVGEVVLRHADSDVREKMVVASGDVKGELVVLQRGMKITNRNGTEYAFVYGLVSHKVEKDKRSKQRVLTERDISVFVPNMFKTKLGSSRSMASR
jgi:hypothetical protein